MNLIEGIHDSRVHTRRTRVLAGAASLMLPPGLRILDVGCGDGLFASTLSRLRPDLEVAGAELAPRANCLIPAVAFDGEHLPFADGEFGACVLIDVLHHAAAPVALLREAARVGGGRVLLKDHNRTGLAAGPILRLMDKVGNRRHGVALPYTYLSPAEWERAFEECGLEVEQTDPLRRLYPFPASLVFGRRLHFMALLRRSRP